jgi:putative N6-adenine-specific DNA methylase
VIQKPADTPQRLFATAARGTEGALRDELRDLGFRGIRADRGGVHLAGDMTEGFRACLELRIALRVLYRLARFDAPNGDALYDGVRAVDLQPFLSARHTLAIRAVCHSSALTHSQFVAQRTKDAIVDRLRERTGQRPSVDLDDPDVTFFVHIVRDSATLYLDLAGASLHRRGYRTRPYGAPLKENLAAAILRLSGWTREDRLLDPMCGSGTIPIEAALWARRIAPGLSRGRFGFERWACHDASLARRMQELREEARSNILTKSPPIVGSDIDPDALAQAEASAGAASVSVTFRRAAIQGLSPETPSGFVVTNPPYGERLAASVGLYHDLAQALARHPGHRVALLAGSPAIVRPLRMRPTRSLIVYNGDIQCRLLCYDARSEGKGS